MKDDARGGTIIANIYITFTIACLLNIYFCFSLLVTIINGKNNTAHLELRCLRNSYDKLCFNVKLIFHQY